MTSGTPDTFLIEDQLREIERMAAADLVMKARNVQTLSKNTRSLQERRAYERAFEQLRDQAAAAAAAMARPCPDDSVPEFLAVGSTVDLEAPRRRIPA